MTLLIKNGTIVTATDQYQGDVFIDGEKITTIGTSLAMSADRDDRRHGEIPLPRRDRRPHASRHAVWRDDLR